MDSIKQDNRVVNFLQALLTTDFKPCNNRFMKAHGICDCMFVAEELKGPACGFIVSGLQDLQCAAVRVESHQCGVKTNGAKS